MIEMLIILCRSHVEENHKKLQQRNPILLSDSLTFHDYVTKDVNGAQKIMKSIQVEENHKNYKKGSVSGIPCLQQCEKGQNKT